MKKRWISLLLMLSMALSLLPTTALAVDPPDPDRPLSVTDLYFKDGAVKEGWYNLKCLYKYINIDNEGDAELRHEVPTTAYYVQSQAGDGQYTIKTREGKYLSIAGEVKNGARVTTSDTPYLWRLKPGHGVYGCELRPAANTGYAANASEKKFIDGTHFLLWQTPELVNYNWSDYINAIVELKPLNEKGEEVNPYRIKMSSWAYPALAYLEKTPVFMYGDDFTKPISRKQMAEEIMWIQSRLLPGIPVGRMPITHSRDAEPEFADTEFYAARYLVYWGITNGVGNNKFDPGGLVTREQIASFLVRTMDYLDTQVYTSVHPVKTKGNLSQFGDANQISAWAKNDMAIMVGSGYMSGSNGKLDPGGYCTIEQATLLCDRIIKAYQDCEAVNEGTSPSVGPQRVTISTHLGGYVTINAEGKGVVNKSQSQTFIRNFTEDGMQTLQTEAGRYLAISGPFMDGKPLLVQSEPYKWYVTENYSPGYGNVVIQPGKDSRYTLNISGASTKDGASVIIYTSKIGTPDPNGNANFSSADNEKFKITVLQ